MDCMAVPWIQSKDNVDSAPTRFFIYSIGKLLASTSGRAHLQLVGSVEVLESHGDTLAHGLLTFTDPHSWVVVSEKNVSFNNGQSGQRFLSTYFLFGLSSPSGLPTCELTYSFLLIM